MQKVKGDITYCVFYGCWNDITYRTKANANRPPRDNVLDHVKKELTKKHEPADMFILAGDNIYAHKQKDASGNKISTFYRESLRVLNTNYWEKALPNMGKKIFLFALGNHNIENKAVYNLVKPKITSFIPSSSVHGPVFPNFFWYDHRGSRFIVIDTNVFDQEGNKPVTAECEWIRRAISTRPAGYNIIVIGHHPIVSIDVKTDSPTLGMSHAKELFECFPRRQDDKKARSYYLCADTHNYQQADLITDTRIVKQIISGTGGAKPDIISSDLMEKCKGTTFEIPELQCNMRVIDMGNPFGYCMLKIDKNGLHCRYVRIRTSRAKGRIHNTNNNISENKTYVHNGKVGNVISRAVKPAKESPLPIYDSSSMIKI